MKQVQFVLVQIIFSHYVTFSSLKNRNEDVWLNNRKSICIQFMIRSQRYHDGVNLLQSKIWVTDKFENDNKLKWKCTRICSSHVWVEECQRNHRTHSSGIRHTLIQEPLYNQTLTNDMRKCEERRETIKKIGVWRVTRRRRSR